MGSRTEKLLLETAQEHGYAGIRVDFGTGYGFHSPHDAGDLIVGRPHQFIDDYEDYFRDAVLSDLYIIEEKYKSTDANKYLQEDGEKLDAMIEFAEAIGATPVFAGRWSSQVEWSPGADHYLLDAREVERTKSGNVSLKPETAIDRYQTADTFFEGRGSGSGSGES